MVFNILANNTDDHNKNFSFLMDRQGRWSLSPAYDLTFIFNIGGFQPETRHCLMVCGKYSDITLEDVKSLASENGIRKADDIIQEVAGAILEFRTLAERYVVQERWISAIESTLRRNLEDWGLHVPTVIGSYTDDYGQRVENVRIEQQFKGNYHLLATIDGREYKYIIRKGTPEQEKITAQGLSNMTEAEMKNLVDRFLLPKTK